MPIDPAVHRGDYCPKCGAPMQQVAGPYQHRQASGGSRPRRPLSVLVDNLRSVYNAGAIFRTADGVGVLHLYLGGITPTPDRHPEMLKTALGAERALAWSAHPDALALGRDLQADGFCLLALETTPQSTPIFEFDLHQVEARPLLLVIGNEQAGIDPGLLDLCDFTLSIPMAGAKASLNVAVAFGVAAYWLSHVL